MDSNGYVGRFGDTLRKLTALQAQEGAFAPQQIGGADTASPFSAPPPGALDAPKIQAAPQPVEGMQPQSVAGSGLGETPPSAPPVGDFGAGAGAAIDESGAMGQTGTTWQDLMKQMPKDQKVAMADQIEAKVGDLPGVYKATAEKVGVTPRKHASREHMAMFLAEIALRAAANRGTSESDGEALAKGVLQTQERRAGLVTAEQERQRAEAEKRRLEGREDAKEDRRYGREDTNHTRDRGEKLADDERNHQQALELERLRAAAQARQAKGQNVRVIVDDNNEYKLIDLDTKETIAVTEEVDETTPSKGSRGQGTTPGGTKKVRKPVKAAAKPNASGLDQDTILNKIAATVKEIKADTKQMRALRREFANDEAKVNEAVEKMARDRVHGDVQSLGGTKEIDFNELP